ncbi:MAG: hypothetical protein D8M58_07480 [Calditrichaeota bacterium]|nr:MAG: hypothetical protein DWQ03_19010 [Calditrichota bacterium]MBL1205222.1 hypothetical protein [Calditrichota bacterium]NOG45051.1 hypothetical protein [Calditrichota bacterium]
MRRFNLILTLAVTLLSFLFTSSVFAQDSSLVQKKNQYKKEVKQNKGQKGALGFVDENGDGYNDNAPDDDGDGIPNGQDEDYTGPKLRQGNGKGFVDADGDGINDNAMDDDGDGIPNGQDADFVRPQDGSGRQNKNGKGGQGKGMKGSGNGSGLGTGDCDGTGPKGNKRNKGNGGK